MIVEEPLFRNYLFVNMAPDRYRETLGPQGAVSIVMFDGRPAEIPAAEVEGVRKLVESALPFNPYPYLKAGHRVRVKDGPLVGCEGVLIRRKGLTRLVLSVHMLQQSVIAEVDAACVEPHL